MKWLLLMLLLFSGTSATEEGCREVEVEETRVCQEREVEECGVCTTLHVRECTIQMEVAWVPIRVKRCVDGQQSAGCTRGGRQLCRTHYRTSCGTRMEYHDMEEDYPKCRRERVNTCTEEEQQEEQEKEEKEGKERCREVEAMRCSIEKRTVRKAKPVSSCRRVPFNMCAKKKCKKVPRKCYETVKMSREQRPKERCKLKPRRVCRGQGCRMVTKQECRVSPSGTKRMMTICPGAGAQP